MAVAPFMRAARTSCARSPIRIAASGSKPSLARRCAKSFTLSSSVPARSAPYTRAHIRARARTARRCAGEDLRLGRADVHGHRLRGARKRLFDAVVDLVLAPSDVGVTLAVERDGVLDHRGVAGIEQPRERLAQRRADAASQHLRRRRGNAHAVQRMRDRARDAGIVVRQRAVEIEQSTVRGTLAHFAGARIEANAEVDQRAALARIPAQAVPPRSWRVEDPAAIAHVLAAHRRDERDAFLVIDLEVHGRLCLEAVVEPVAGRERRALLVELVGGDRECRGGARLVGDERVRRGTRTRA